MNNFKTIKLTILIILGIIIVGITLNHFDHNSEINYHKKLNPKYYENISFEMDEKYKNDEIYNNIETGKNIAKNSKIVICSLARNIESCFQDTKKKFEFIGNNFDKYKIVIFENDSKDNSRSLIKNWTKENPNVILLDCLKFGDYDCNLKTKTGYEYGMTSRDRIKKMAMYREEYLNYVKTNLNSYDYMLVSDFDLNGNQSMDGMFHSLSKKDWDAVFINGHNPFEGTFGRITGIYDGMAYVDINSKLKYNFNNNFVNILISIYNIILQNCKVNLSKQCFIPVKSAFNGYGLYKIDSIKNSSYIDDYYCEHLNLNLDLYKKNKKLYINKLWKGYFEPQGPGSCIDIIKSQFNLN